LLAITSIGASATTKSKAPTSCPAALATVTPEYIPFLREQGVTLEVPSIVYIVETVEAGHLAALEHFGLYPERKGMSGACSKGPPNISYPSGSDCVIDISVEWFNQFTKSLSIGPEIGQLTTSTEYATMTVAEYLFAVGIEETIHHMQDIKHPKTHATLKPGLNRFTMGRDLYILTSFEVEARQMVDQVLIDLGRRPVWTQMEATLRARFPHTYGKTDLIED